MRGSFRFGPGGYPRTDRLPKHFRPARTCYLRAPRAQRDRGRSRPRLPPPGAPMRWAPWLLAALAASLLASPAHTAPLTLERIMADPDWIGPPVERPYWSLDGRSLFFSLKRAGSPVHDLERVAASGGAYRPVPAADLADLDAADPVFDRART